MAPFYDFGDFETAPSQGRNLELVDVPVFGFAVRLLADDPGAIGQLQDDPQLTKSRLLASPANLGQAAEIHQSRFGAEADRPIAVGAVDWGLGIED